MKEASHTRHSSGWAGIKSQPHDDRGPNTWWLSGQEPSCDASGGQKTEGTSSKYVQTWLQESGVTSV